MRALLMSAPNVQTVVAERPEPAPGPGQVAIDVAYAGINFLDVMARRGDRGYVPAWPFVPGLEVAGTIRAVGPEVTGLAVGGRVAAFTRGGGGLATVAVADAELVIPVPDEVSLAVASSAPLMLSTALLLLTDVARLRAGESVLMHSAGGGVGGAVAQLVGILGGGLRLGTVGRPDKIAAAERAGWDVVLPRDDDLAAAVRQAAGGGVDVVLDASGTQLLEVDLAIAAPGARIVLFGNAGGGAPEPLPQLGRLIGGNVALAGFSISGLPAAAPARVAAALVEVLRLLASGQLQAPVTEVEGLDAVPAIHDLLAAGRGSGKYVVSVGG